MSKIDIAIDSAIGFFSPKAAFKRQQFRKATETIRKYDGASTGRRTDNWTAQSTSANAEISLAINKLRDRSRDLGRNNPYAKRAIQTIANNTVGRGIRLTSHKKASQSMRDTWATWAETTACDFDGLFTFYGLQRLVMRTVAESGEALVRRRRVTDGVLPVQLQVLEGDFLDHTKNDEGFFGGNYIVQGVEFNDAGKRVAYWIWDRHPSDALNNKVTRVDASEVLHIYEVLRPGQVRGVPFGVSAMIKLRDFDDYEDAELIRKKIAACFSVFITDPDGTDVTTTERERLEKVEPGIIEYLEPGKEVTFAAPPAAEGYEPYSRNVLRAIASGYGVTYEAMTGDYSNVNFSSGRMGWIEMHRNVEGWQIEMLIPRFCDKVWAWFLNGYEIQTGEQNNLLAEWTPPRREMIDPTKETEAVIKQIRAGLISWQEAVRQHGLDPEVILEQLASDLSDRDRLGLQLEIDIRYDKGKQQAGASNGAEQNTNK